MIKGASHDVVLPAVLQRLPGAARAHLHVAGVFDAAAVEAAARDARAALAPGAPPSSNVPRPTAGRRIYLVGWLSTYLREVNAVTPATVRELADRWLKGDQFAIAVAGDAKVIQEQLAPCGEVIP